MLKRRYYTAEEQRGFCKKYLSGNQSRKDFCARHDINPKNLSRWLVKLQSQPKEENFIPIGELAESNNIAAEILLAKGISIKLKLKLSEIHNLIKDLA